jgi:hypothetical protein
MAYRHPVSRARRLSRHNGSQPTGNSIESTIVNGTKITGNAAKPTTNGGEQPTLTKFKRWLNEAESNMRQLIVPPLARGPLQTRKSEPVSTFCVALGNLVLCRNAGLLITTSVIRWRVGGVAAGYWVPARTLTM